MARIVAEGCRERCMDPNSPVSNWVVYFLILVFLHSIFSIILLYFNHSIVVFCLWILDSQYIGLKVWWQASFHFHPSKHGGLTQYIKTMGVKVKLVHRQFEET